MKKEEARDNPNLKDVIDDVRPTVSFLVDVTTNKDAYKQKEEDFKKYELKSGKKSNVLCYKNKYGVLGIDAPMCLVLKQEDFLASIADKFRFCMQAVPGKGFMITDEERFNIVYKEFFDSFISSVQDNSASYIQFLSEQNPSTQKQCDLINSYQDIVDFCKAYKNTPVV